MAGAPTPAIAALTRAKVPHTLHPYHHEPGTTAFGDEVVTALGWPPERVFKTLVASVDGTLTVGIVPVAAQLDLKALAAATGGKKASMAGVAESDAEGIEHHVSRETLAAFVRHLERTPRNEHR